MTSIKSFDEPYDRTCKEPSRTVSTSGTVDAARHYIASRQQRHRGRPARPPQARDRADRRRAIRYRRIRSTRSDRRCAARGRRAAHIRHRCLWRRARGQTAWVSAARVLRSRQYHDGASRRGIAASFQSSISGWRGDTVVQAPFAHRTWLDVGPAPLRVPRVAAMQWRCRLAGRESSRAPPLRRRQSHGRPARRSAPPTRRRGGRGRSAAASIAATAGSCQAGRPRGLADGGMPRARRSLAEFVAAEAADSLHAGALPSCPLISYLGSSSPRTSSPESRDHGWQSRPRGRRRRRQRRAMVVFNLEIGARKQHVAIGNESTEGAVFRRSPTGASRPSHGRHARRRGLGREIERRAGADLRSRPSRSAHRARGGRLKIECRELGPARSR